LTFYLLTYSSVDTVTAEALHSSPEILSIMEITKGSTKGYEDAAGVVELVGFHLTHNGSF